MKELASQYIERENEENQGWHLDETGQNETDIEITPNGTGIERYAIIDEYYSSPTILICADKLYLRN